MTMSRKDHRTIAAAIRTERELYEDESIPGGIHARVALGMLARRLADEFYANSGRDAQGNRSFDRYRFLDAALGIGHEREAG